MLYTSNVIGGRPSTQILNESIISLLGLSGNLGLLVVPKSVCLYLTIEGSSASNFIIVSKSTAFGTYVGNPGAMNGQEGDQGSRRVSVSNGR